MKTQHQYVQSEDDQQTDHATTSFKNEPHRKLKHVKGPLIGCVAQWSNVGL